MSQFRYLLFVFGIFFLVVSGCKENETKPKVDFTKIEGKTMGTTYHISYSSKINLQNEIDSLLVDFNNSVSTYIPTSTISKFNQANKEYCFNQQDDPFFLESLSRALEISLETDGAFDPTVMSLVNYWGFGYGGRDEVKKPNEKVLDSLLSLVGYKKIGIMTKNDTICIFKEKIGMQLDLSASAKGHGVDLVASLIASKGIENYLVEIGGECVASGVNDAGKPWIIGINKPQKGAAIDEIQFPVDLSEKALATSGNYRNFYESGEITYAHTINPVTGYALPSDILSASIIANDCLTADAFATACMVLGLEKSKKLINENPELEACFIYANADKSDFGYYMSDGFKERVDTTQFKFEQ